MAKMPNQKLKLLYLMRILQARTDADHAMTLSEISAELAKYDISAERKSLYDDIEMLKLYGAAEVYAVTAAAAVLKKDEK